MGKNRKRQRGGKNRKRQRGGGVKITGGNFLNEFKKAASLLGQKAKNKFIQVKRQKGGIIRRRRTPMGYNLWKYGPEVYNMY